MVQEQLEKDFIKEIENQEAHYWSEYYLCCCNPLADKLGINVKIIDGAFCCTVSKLDVLAFNRVLGAGLNSPISKVQLEEIIDFYKSAGAKRFFIQVSPAAQPENNHELLNEMGFEHYNNWAKFYMKLDGKNFDLETELNIDELQLSETGMFEEIMKDAFGFEKGLEAIFAQSYKRPGWKHYLAKETDKPIAAASLFICGKYASLAIAGTKRDERGKGAQCSLINRRIKDAVDAGCEYVVVETAEDKPEKPSASNRNVKRAGLELAYLRPNYIYSF